MDILKRRNPGLAAASDGSRRSFIRKLGAGASAAVASTVVAARQADAEGPALRAALLEEEKALRRLHHDFEQAIDRRRHEQVTALFAADAVVTFNGGVFRGLAGIARLYRDHLPARHAGRPMQPAPGFEPAGGQQQESIEVAVDRRSATATFPYSIQLGRPLESDSSLASMARLHGEGVQTWWEGGLYRASYRKDAEGRWRISRLEYDTLSRADYRSGRSYARPMAAALLTERFPRDPQGPDDLLRA